MRPRNVLSTIGAGLLLSTSTGCTDDPRLTLLNDGEGPERESIDDTYEPDLGKISFDDSPKEEPKDKMPPDTPPGFPGQFALETCFAALERDSICVLDATEGEYHGPCLELLDLARAHFETALGQRIRSYDLDPEGNVLNPEEYAAQLEEEGVLPSERYVELIQEKGATLQWQDDDILAISVGDRRTDIDAAELAESTSPSMTPAIPDFQCHISESAVSYRVNRSHPTTEYPFWLNTGNLSDEFLAAVTLLDGEPINTSFDYLPMNSIWLDDEITSFADDRMGITYDNYGNLFSSDFQGPEFLMQTTLERLADMTTDTAFVAGMISGSTNSDDTGEGRVFYEGSFFE